MRKPVRSDEGAVELPEAKGHGTYPPDIARRRRQLGLPVTPEEHAAYARGEYPEPPVTDASRARRGECATAKPPGSKPSRS
jgi:hypothetical protein